MTAERNGDQLAQIGVVGMAVMGSNLARNFASKGHTVAIYNRSPEKTRAVAEEFGHEGTFLPAETIEEFVASLERPRKAVIMVQAGAATDAVISQLVEAMDEGDIIIDGGNSLFTDTIRRELGPLLEDISAKVDGTPCVTHIGPDGAGHFVKMVHNGIEYADMQVIGEAYHLLRYAAGLEPSEIADIFTEWNKGDLDSYLIEITAEVLRQVDAKTGKPFIDVIVDAAGQKGTGRWTVKEALDLGVPTTGIGEAVFARALSSALAQREAAQEISLPAGETETLETVGVDKQSFIEDVRRALYASKLVAYAQGFDEISAGSQEHNWDIKPGDLARIWRGGCIIRAKFLDRITEAYENDPQLPSLLLDPYFKGELEKGLVDSWRRVVVTATQLGLPVPVFASSLSYYDSLRATRLPAALIQGQRDFFGAHTYRRVDMEGTFHTTWSGEREELSY